MTRDPPRTIWLRQSSTENKRFYETLFTDEPDAVRYVRAEAHEMLLDALAAALNTLTEDNYPDGAIMILRTALQAKP